MKSPRERALAHLKTLAAAGVVLGCGGGSAHGGGGSGPAYGVVDPMPMPSCFENPPIVVTTKLLEKTADGTRLVEVAAKYQQTDTKVTDLGANTPSGTHLEVTDKVMKANDFRGVVHVPKDVTAFFFSAAASCGQGSGFSQYIEVTDTEATIKP